MAEYNSGQGLGESGQTPDVQGSYGYQQDQPYGYQQAPGGAGSQQGYGYQQPYGTQQTQAYDNAQQPYGYQQGQYQQPSGYQQPGQYGYQDPNQQYGYQQPGQYGYQQPGQYGYQQPYYGQPAPEPDKSTLYIVLSVLEFLFCGGLLAIIPFVFSLQYRTEYQAGRFDAALSKKKSAKKSLIIILIVGIVLTVAMIAGLMFLSFTVYEAEQTGQYPAWLEEVMEEGADTASSAAGAIAAGAVSAASSASATSDDAQAAGRVITTSEFYTITLPSTLEDAEVVYQEGTMGGPTTVGSITSVIKDDQEVFEVACFSNDWGVQGTYGSVDLGSPSADPSSVVFLYVPADPAEDDMSKAIEAAQEKAGEYAAYVTVL